MSEHHHPPVTAETLRPGEFSGLRNLLGLAGVAGIGVSLAWAFLFNAQQQFAHSWLFAFMFGFTISAGALFWVLLHHAVHANWSVVVRRVLEHMSANLAVLIVLFIPLWMFKERIYEWMTPGDLEGHGIHLYHHKKPLLNIPVWTVASFGIIGALAAAALLFRRGSVKQDETGSLALSFAMRGWAFRMIPVFAVSLTFGAIFWLMSTDFKWASTMWGVYIFAGSAWSAMALLIIVVWALKQRGYLAVVNIEHYHIMGKLLFAFTVFWAYIAFSQYFLIWYANIPEETVFYLRRNEGGWKWLSYALTAGHFALPFLALLTQRVKRTPGLLVGVCVWVLLMHALDMYWNVLPLVYKDGLSFHVLDLTCLAGVAGVLGFFLLRNLGTSALYAHQDPRLSNSIEMVN
jgi:hypothetical protein